jgi:hypothetical protein
VTIRIGSPVAVRRFSPSPFQAEDFARTVIHADNIEVICGYSLDLS